ncbi:type VI secretion system Vgr family protein [Marinimicrobium sp. ARAG 43.8]|uniref:type VI secretion system Vgr family protein n=1 Tax=Marinimicrobium sp. ARAG 43.8 TaxID=3418719 RepID=UPI003CF50FE5
MQQLTQENRLVTISDFSLGEDTFLVTKFSGSEYVSGLYRFDVTLISESPSIRPSDIMGKAGSVTLQDEHGRVFSGHVSCFQVGEVDRDNARTYTMILEPWLAFFRYNINHRIFQDKTTKDIVSEVFSNNGLKDFEFRAAPGARREYCVQHGESDLHFILRILEEDGISFYFEHTDGKHKLILLDQSNGYASLQKDALEYSGGSSPTAKISQWQHSYRYQTGQVTVTDFDFKEPGKSLMLSARSSSDFAHSNQFEIYQYPGYYHPQDHDRDPRMRMQAQELELNTVSGSSNYSQMVAGGKFTLAKHESSEEKGDYVLLEVHHEIVDETQKTGGERAQSYNNRFLCVRSDTTIRPMRMHGRPTMSGPQTASVVGPAGEEVYIDELGRIKVQFHWDREGERNESSSCFLRVTQSWAGNQWGAFFIPRIGQEVVVDFLSGDPDRPLVTGAVYNGKNRPVYSSKTQSGIKTRSTKGGGPDNYNEFRFEDKKGSEQILLHAEKNYDVEVENNQSLTIENNRQKTIRNDESSIIENDRKKTVNNNQSENVGKDKTIEVGENHREVIGKSKNLEVKEDHTETIGNNMVISVNKDLSERVGGSYRENVKERYELNAKSIQLQADDEITLKTGSAMIHMKSNGDITIKGESVNVKGSGTVAIKGNKVTSN